MMVETSLWNVSAQISHLPREHVPSINAATLDETCFKIYKIATLSSLHSSQLTHTPPEGGIFMQKHVTVIPYIYNIMYLFVKMNMFIQNARNKQHWKQR